MNLPGCSQLVSSALVQLVSSAVSQFSQLSQLSSVQSALWGSPIIESSSQPFESALSGRPMIELPGCQPEFSSAGQAVS